MGWLSFLKQKTPVQKPPMKKFLIVGLGNVGNDYSQTRHNIGFEVLDQLANKLEGQFETQKLGQVAWCKFKGRSVVLLKPSTYMNLSGKAVKYWLQQEKIAKENLLVVTDDLNLEFGTIRIKTKGSDGGHNGLGDIQNQLQTTQYPRLRFGIGGNFKQGGQVEFVLGKWTKQEQSALPQHLEHCVNAICSFVFEGITQSMNQFNRKSDA